MFKYKFNIAFNYNSNYIIHQLTSYYSNHKINHLRKNAGLYEIEKRIKNISSPLSRIGSRIQFTISPVDQNNSKIIGTVQLSGESKYFLVFLIISIFIILFFLSNDFINNTMSTDRTSKSLFWLLLIIIFIFFIINSARNKRYNLKEEFNEILKSNVKKRQILQKNYCPKCNKIETKENAKFCGICNGRLTTIV